MANSWLGYFKGSVEGGIRSDIEDGPGEQLKSVGPTRHG
jgi:hypothetical protein